MPYKNPEDQRVAHRKWQLRNRERWNAYKRRYRALNPEINREYDRKAYNKRKELKNARRAQELGDGLLDANVQRSSVLPVGTDARVD